MKPLLVLLITFVVSFSINRFLTGNFDFSLSGKIAMAGMLLFTALGHFTYTSGMAMMLPAFVPCKNLIIYLTGILEIFAAVGIFIPLFKQIAAWLLIIFFILILPANVFASIRHIDYQKADFNGKGLGYLWFRIPLQIMFIVWVYIFIIKK